MKNPILSVTAFVFVLSVASGCVSVVDLGRAAKDSHVEAGSLMNPTTDATGFLNKIMVVNGRPRAYVVYVPRNYDPSRPWPMVLFLHGAGERGDDGLKQSDVGLGHAIRFWPERFPCIVAMPQCPEGIWWDEAVADIDLCLKQTLSEFNIDRDRVYLTGLSMGGYGTWQYGARHTDVFAGFMPICGGGRIEDAAALAQVPIWAFHGAKDDVVSPDESRKMVEAVRKAGGNIQYTEYPDLNHNSWDATYSDAKAVAWLLAQSK